MGKVEEILSISMHKSMIFLLNPLIFFHFEKQSLNIIHRRSMLEHHRVLGITLRKSKDIIRIIEMQVSSRGVWFYGSCTIGEGKLQRCIKDFTTMLGEKGTAARKSTNQMCAYVHHQLGDS